MEAPLPCENSTASKPAELARVFLCKLVDRELVEISGSFEQVVNDLAAVLAVHGANAAPALAEILLRHDAVAEVFADDADVSAVLRDTLPSKKKKKTKLAWKVARSLGEKDPIAVGKLHNIVARLGEDAVEDLVRRTDEVEAAGGMMLPDGSRRRTRGGVFFKLAAGALAEVQRARRKVRGQEDEQQRAAARRVMLDVIAEVLGDAGAVLSVAEIVERAGPRLVTRCRDRGAEIGGAMSDDIRALGGASRFERAQDGHYSLRPGQGRS